MQGVIGYSLEVEHMPINESDRAWVREQVQNRGIIAAIKGWTPLAAMVAIGVFVFTQWGDYKEFRGSTTERLKRIEGDVKDIRDDLRRNQAETNLTQAGLEARIGQKDAAIQRISEVTQSLEQLTTDHVPAPSSFFQSAVNQLDQMRSAGIGDLETSPLSMQLAAYRSALNPQPPIPQQRKTFDSISVTISGVTYGQFTHSVTMQGCGELSSCTGFTVLLDGRAIDATGMPPNEDLFVVPSNSVEKNKDRIHGGIFIGSSQTLDGIEWQNVTFVGTKIKYAGGSTKLENVTFVNCIFDVLPSANGTRLTNYAALDNRQALALPAS